MIDYDALSALIAGLEAVHEDGRVICSYAVTTGTAAEAEENDGTAVVYLRFWDETGALYGQSERGRFPADATADIAECMRLAIEEAGQ